MRFDDQGFFINNYKLAFQLHTYLLEVQQEITRNTQSRLALRVGDQSTCKKGGLLNGINNLILNNNE